MHDTGCLGLVHWDDPEGWYGEGGGRRVQDGEHMYTCGRFILIEKQSQEESQLKERLAALSFHVTDLEVSRVRLCATP